MRISCDVLIILNSYQIHPLTTQLLYLHFFKTHKYLACVAFHRVWSVHQGTKTLKKPTLPLLSSYQMLMAPPPGVRLHHLSPLSMLGFGLAWACTGHINANIIPWVCMCICPMWSEDTVSLWSSTTYGSYSLSTPSSTIIPNPWEKRCDKAHLGLRMPQSLLFPAPWATTGLYFSYLLLWWKIHFCCCDKTPWLNATLKKKRFIWSSMRESHSKNSDS